MAIREELERLKLMAVHEHVDDALNWAFQPQSGRDGIFGAVRPAVLLPRT
jgi:hypothetical protein